MVHQWLGKFRNVALKSTDVNGSRSHERVINYHHLMFSRNPLQVSSLFPHVLTTRNFDSLDEGVFVVGFGRGGGRLLLLLLLLLSSTYQTPTVAPEYSLHPSPNVLKKPESCECHCLWICSQKFPGNAASLTNMCDGGDLIQ